MKNIDKQRAGAARWAKCPWVSVIPELDFRRLYEIEGKSQKEIAASIGVSLKAIQTSMRNFSIAPRRAVKRPLMHQGAACYAWKGGKSKHSEGYILRCAKGHPRATERGGYVFEHILVMEEFLGRFLVDGEIVHHKNRKKDENRIDNLELTTPAAHIELHRDPENGRICAHGAA
jgi:hypothetical protein